MENYYRILGVECTASIAEIKTAFRKKVKKLHPDIQTNSLNADIQNQNSELKLLLNAYKTLLKLKTEKTDPFDFFNFFFTPKTQNKKTTYRERLLQMEGEESKAKLIFFDLFHEHEADAISLYLKLKRESFFSLQPYFSKEDFMDCGFVLAEELYFVNEYYESFLLLEQIVYLEQQEPYFKHFFPEVLLIINSIIKNKLQDSVADDLAIECYKASLNFGLKKYDKANILKKIAESYYRIGDKYNAAVYLNEALQLKPNLYVAGELKKHLEYL